MDIYAEDTTLSAWCKLQNDMDKVVEWSNQNKMVLNGSKMKSLPVTGKRLESRLPEAVEQVSSHKLLGVKLDTKLNFKKHIDDLCKKDWQRIEVLNKVKQNLPISCT